MKRILLAVVFVSMLSSNAVAQGWEYIEKNNRTFGYNTYRANVQESNIEGCSNFTSTSRLGFLCSHNFDREKMDFVPEWSSLEAYILIDECQFRSVTSPRLESEIRKSARKRGGWALVTNMDAKFDIEVGPYAKPRSIILESSDHSYLNYLRGVYKKGYTNSGSISISFDTGATNELFSALSKIEGYASVTVTSRDYDFSVGFAIKPENMKSKIDQIPSNCKRPF